MEVKPGYKRTEVGIIPVEWETHRLGELLQGSRSIRYGIVQPGKFETTGCFMLRSQDYSKGWAGPDGMHRVSTQLENQYKNARIRRNDLVMTVVGAGIGQVVSVPDWLDGAILSRSTARIAIDKDKASPSFVQAFLESPISKRQILDCQKEGAQPVVSCLDLAKFFVAYPPPREQHIIAEGLSDVDTLLGALDRLIAKKRDLKQAAMQQLLTGQIRLPGFHGEWGEKRLGDLLDYEQPTKYLVKESEYSDDNDVPVLTAGKTFILGYTNEVNGVFDNLPVIIFDDFTTATKYVNFPFKAKSSAMKILKPRVSTINLRLVFEIMQSIQFKLGDHKRYWISEYQHLQIKIPTAEEQTAIAEVLTEMDAELAALEQRREKSRALKQAMMQELLAGKTKLV